MVKQRTLYEDRIVVDPEIMVGKPVVKGTRIPVELVLAHLAETPDIADLFAAYPRLTLDDIKACLAYAKRTHASPHWHQYNEGGQPVVSG